MTDEKVKELAEKYIRRMGRSVLINTVVSEDSEESLWYPIPIKPLPCDADFCAKMVSEMGANIAREAHELGRTQGPQWVSVSERLPDTDGKYLCWHDDEMPVISFFTAQSFYNDGEPQDVTHWMPLPKNPVE